MVALARVCDTEKNQSVLAKESFSFSMSIKVESKGLLQASQ